MTQTRHSSLQDLRIVDPCCGRSKVSTGGIPASPVFTPGFQLGRSLQCFFQQHFPISMFRNHYGHVTGSWRLPTSAFATSNERSYQEWWKIWQHSWTTLQELSYTYNWQQWIDCGRQNSPFRTPSLRPYWILSMFNSRWRTKSLNLLCRGLGLKAGELEETTAQGNSQGKAEMEDNCIHH